MYKFCFDGDVLYMCLTTDPQLGSYEVTKSNIFILGNITSLNPLIKVASFLTAKIMYEQLGIYFHNHLVT